MNEKILQILAEVSGTDAESIKENTRLADGVSIPDEVFPTLHTAGDVFAAAKKVLGDA